MASGPAPEPPGSAVTVLVRPAAAQLVPSTAGESLPGQVLHVVYRGHGYDHLVGLADGTQLAGVFAPERRRRGGEVPGPPDSHRGFAYPAHALTLTPDSHPG